jgi:hypothetical protein
MKANIVEIIGISRDNLLMNSIEYFFFAHKGKMRKYVEK